ncbi:hypothetical protein [Phenylobacterium sp.]|uniref:hypothetical protein n=1 Tax=Phenylobacterium sp. TaxID=1871053 RepID=UPI003920430D
MKALLLAPALLLAACATNRAEPEIRTVEVQVPVAKACVPADLPAKPSAYADDALDGTTPPDERYRLTATANQQRKARLARIEPVIAACR